MFNQKLMHMGKSKKAAQNRKAEQRAAMVVKAVFIFLVVLGIALLIGFAFY